MIARSHAAIAMLNHPAYKTNSIFFNLFYRILRNEAALASSTVSLHISPRG